MTLEELQLHDQLAKAMIKIHNLHIALNKKVDKNKNQALEITKLLEQKKDLQTIANVSQIKLHTIEEQIKKAYLDRDFAIAFNQKLKDENIALKDKINQLNSSGTNKNDTKSNYIDDLHNRLKEKDIIISYLRNELK